MFLDTCYYSSLNTVMDGLLHITPLKIPRPQVYTTIEMAIIERAKKVFKLVSNSGLVFYAKKERFGLAKIMTWT